MDTTFDPTLENDIKELMKEVPAPIRAFFASGKVEIVAKNLMQKYRLHIDQGAIVEREIILLLLGLKDPAEFTQTLVEEARLDQQTVSRIVQDVNAQIFVPLREEMRKGQSVEVKPPQAQSAAAQTPPRANVLQPRTTIIPANPNLPARPAQTLASVPRYIPPKKYFNLQNKIPPRLAVVRQPADVGGPPPSFPAPSIPASPELQRGEQLPASRLLEDHEEPHIDISEKVRKVYEPPPNLPGAIQSTPIPEPPHPKSKPAVPVVPYSADPYREPIDEK